jgi:hypothetical protein
MKGKRLEELRRQFLLPVRRQLNELLKKISGIWHGPSLSDFALRQSLSAIITRHVAFVNRPVFRSAKSRA